MAAPRRKKQQKPQPKPGAKAKRKPSKSRSPKPETPKRGPGNPTSYRPAYAKTAYEMCQNGATDAEIADFFRISTTTFYAWQHRHPEFLEAIKIGKAPADDRVERSVFQRAVGYEYTEEQAIKLRKKEGEVIEIVKVRKFNPGDPVSAFFWLKNRRKDVWRDKHEIEGMLGLDLESLLKGARLVEERRKAVEPLTIEGTVIVRADETK